MWRPRDIDLEKPLYLAIADALQRDIADGTIAPGARLPTHRELADIVGVDVSTVTRAYKESERRGLLSGTVGRGTFVSADVGVSVPLVRGDTFVPDLLEMGLVLPLYSLEGRVADTIRENMASMDLSRFLRYSDPRGMEEHRAAGAIWVNRYGLSATASDILVTSGTQNGLSCALMALLRPGDRIAVDALTYPGLKTVASMLNIRLVSIEMDGAGMLPDALEAACRREAIRALYLMPEVQNPTTSTLPDERREAIAVIIEKHDLILLEDDAYADTRERRNAALSARLPDNALFFGGISKVFGAGLRVSFLAAPARWRSALERAILASVWMASPLCSAIVSGIIADGSVEAIIRSKREEARRRVSLATEKLGAWRFLCPPTGFFGWLELPRPWSGKEFELAAAASGVRVLCAEKFAVGKDTPAAVRLSLSGPETIDELSRGVDVLVKILTKDRWDGDGVF